MQTRDIVASFISMLFVSPAFADFSSGQMVPGNFSTRWSASCDQRGVCSFGDPDLARGNHFVLWKDGQTYQAPWRSIPPTAFDDQGNIVSVNPVATVNDRDGSFRVHRVIVQRRSLLRPQETIEYEVPGRLHTKLIDVAQNNAGENITVSMEARKLPTEAAPQPITLRFGTLTDEGIREFGRARIARRLDWRTLSRILIDELGNFYVEVDAGDNARSLRPRSRNKEVCIGNVRSAAVRCTRGSVVDRTSMPSIAGFQNGRLLATRYGGSTIYLDGRPFGGALRQISYSHATFTPDSLSLARDGTIAGRLNQPAGAHSKSELFVVAPGSDRVNILGCTGPTFNQIAAACNEAWPISSQEFLYLNRNCVNGSDASLDLGIYRLSADAALGDSRLTCAFAQ